MPSNFAPASRTIRNAILAELTRRGWSRYKLASLPEVTAIASPSFIYTYLRGKSETTTATAEVLLNALDLTVSPSRR